MPDTVPGVPLPLQARLKFWRTKMKRTQALTSVQDKHDRAGESGGVDYSPLYFTKEHLKLIKKQGRRDLPEASR
ncbi:MAG: hypothetical protein A2234_05835 [Elusimicrobia bacterium RIFOXYA2_FULL_58_8]|nr:MAG: hypothetical protein A2234_05835 [Elusimicrobia bacterium RIFOXYA2_FULL_58_8]